MVLPEIKGEIRFQNLNFQYNEGEPVCERFSLTIPPGETAEASFEPGRGFVYKDSFVHVLRFRSTGSMAQRGIFVSIALDVDPRPRRP